MARRLPRGPGILSKVVGGATERNWTPSEAFILTQLAEIQLALGNLEQAQANYQKAVDILRSNLETGRGPQENRDQAEHPEEGSGKARTVIGEGADHRYLGRLDYLKSDYEGAKTAFEKALEFAQTSGNADELFTAYTGLGRVYEVLEDYKKAEEYYEKGMNFVEELRASLLPSERKNFFEVRVRGIYRSEPAKGLTCVRMKENRSVQSIDSSEATRARASSRTT